jgi:hypothetical protein
MNAVPRFFWVGSTNLVYGTSPEGSSWATGQPPDTTAPVAPTVSGAAISVDSYGNNVVDLFWVGVGGQLWHEPYASGWRTPSVFIASNMSVSPTVVVPSANRVDLYYSTTTTRALWHRYFQGIWHNAQLVSGVAVGDQPSVAFSPSGSVDVVYTAGDGNVWDTPSTGSTWLTPVNLGGRHGLTLTQSIVAEAESQSGVSDDPSGGFCNPYTAIPGRGNISCSSVYRSEAWCADFADWVWQQAGAETDGTLNAAAASFYQWGKAHGTWHSASSSYVPQPGDAVVYGLNSSGTYADHVGIVVSTTSGQNGPNVVNGDWWSTGNGAVSPISPNQTTATGSDVISGYASPVAPGTPALKISAALSLPALSGPLAAAQPGAYLHR